MIVLHAPTNASVMVRQIPGARYVKAKDSWELPLSWASCVTARGILGDQLDVGPKLAEWATGEKRRRIDPCLALREAKELPPGWDSFFDRVEGGAV